MVTFALLTSTFLNSLWILKICLQTYTHKRTGSIDTVQYTVPLSRGVENIRFDYAKSSYYRSAIYPFFCNNGPTYTDSVNHLSETEAWKTDTETG